MSSALFLVHSAETRNILISQGHGRRQFNFFHDSIEQHGLIIFDTYAIDGNTANFAAEKNAVDCISVRSVHTFKRYCKLK